MKKIIFLLPAIAFLALAVFLGWALFGTEKLNESQVKLKPVIVNKAVREFSLLRLDNEQAFSSNELKGKVWLLNIWASWCVSCVQEHPVLTAIAKADIPIFGLNYQDKPQDAREWLAKHGNPYQLSLIDNGKVSLDFGVYGVPETFVIDKKGIVRHKFTGPISFEEFQQVLLPMIMELKS